MAITTTADLRQSGFSAREILRRCLPSGPWQLLLPGVVLQKPAPPTRLDKLHAAQAFAGPHAVITGADALARQGASLPVPRHIHVLYGENNRRTHPGILFERTTRLPDIVEHGSLRLACPARAAVDMARREIDPRTVVAVLDSVLRSGLCTQADLEEELRLSHQRGTALVRQALRRMAAHGPPGWDGLPGSHDLPGSDGPLSSAGSLGTAESLPTPRMKASSRRSSGRSSGSSRASVESRRCAFEHA